jgi:hypothetical protein
MKEELKFKLLKKYPKLLKDYGGDKKKTCMSWGITCGDGWFDIIDELFEKISKQHPNVYLTQVKEKLGLLRVYFDFVKNKTTEEVEEVWKLVFKSVKKSSKICEFCGKPGNIRKEGWHKILCDACHEKREKNIWQSLYRWIK